MEKTLRIREVTNNGAPASYNNIDLGSAGLTVSRGLTMPAMVRELGALGRETISFVQDTPHNRAFFLQRVNVEVASWQDGEWVVITSDWLMMAFAPAKGAKVPTVPSVQKEANPQGVAKIQNIEGFEKIHKNQQMKAVKSLVDSGAPEGFKQKLLNDIVKSNNPDMAKTVKEYAEQQLKAMAV